jgi:hypothetical protein
VVVLLLPLFSAMDDG